MDRFIGYLVNQIGADTFEHLKIPVIVVAADLWQRRERVSEFSPLAQAVKASMSIAGVFAPAVFDENGPG